MTRSPRTRSDRTAPAVPVPTLTPAPWAIPRGLIVLLAGAGAVVSIAGIKVFAGILGPVFLALMLTVAVQPIQSWMQRRGLPAWIGMITTVLVVYLILIGLIAALAVSAAQLATQLPQYPDTVDDLLEDIRSFLAGAGVNSEQIHNMLSSVDVGKVVGLIESALQGLLGVFSNLFFILALLLFMAFDGMSIGRKMQIVARSRPEIAYALSTFAAGTRKYLVVSTVFGLIVAVLDGGPGLMVWVIVVYCVINFVIQSIIQPKFVGDAVGMSVTVTFLALVFWAWVLGPLGALLAIPMTLLVKAMLLDIDPASRWVNVLIGGDVRSDAVAAEVDPPPPAPDTDRREPDPQPVLPAT
ncbi:AI-2E family transporter [Prescottella equi]|uniref:AI-2E family transporter n=1 Tax=Rhodococcus hoagii TaxID=43767 RepID=UPI000A10CF69|nr:AI-2E family transporter [Prescottella equi]